MTYKFALCLVLLVLFTACSHPSEGNDEADAPLNSVPEVSVARVRRGTISSSLTVTGTIAALPNADVKVSSLVPGRVVQIMATEGDHVGQGQVLGKIEDRPYRDQIRQAEAALAQVKANLDNAKLNLSRNGNLFRRGIAARKDLEDARTQVSVNQAAVAQDAAALSLARLQLSRTSIRSPLSGIVVKRFVSTGEQVDGTPATPLFEVANVDRVELFGNIPATYLGNVRVGVRLPVTSDAFPSQIFRGNVVAISPAVDPATNIGLIRIRIGNPEGLLRLGMFLTAELPLETHSNALIIPSESVYRDRQDEPQAYVVHGSEADAVPIRLGIQTADRAEVLSGLKEGDTIVWQGGYGLNPHGRIRIKQ